MGRVTSSKSLTGGLAAGDEFGRGDLPQNVAGLLGLTQVALHDAAADLVDRGDGLAGGEVGDLVFSSDS